MGRQSPLGDLDPEQREAVTAPPGPLAVIAPAGSGKTRVIAHRAAYAAAEHGISPAEILAISYTNKAVAEMAERLGALLGGPGERVSCSTFHSLGARVLRSAPEAAGRTERFAILAGSDSEAAMREALTELGSPAAELSIRGVLGRIARAKAAGETPAALRERGLDQVADAWVAYRERLREADALDFGDLLCGAVAVLEGRAEVRERHRRRFGLVLVDEYQDVVPAQQRLLELLVGERASITCVGDPRQAIMGYAGAEGSYLERFAELFPGARVVELRTTYRCPAEVTRFAERGSGLGGALRSARGLGPRVSVGRFDCAAAEAGAVAGVVAELLGRGALAPHEVVVLARTRAAIVPLQRELAGAGVPHRVIGGTGLYERAVVRDALAFCQAAHNPRNRIAARRCAARIRGLGRRSLEALDRFARASGLGLGEAAARAEEIEGLAARQRRACLGLAEAITQVAEAAESRGVADAVRAAAGASRWPYVLRARGDAEAKAELARLAKLQRAAAAHQARAPGGGLGGFLEQVALIGEGRSDEEAVAISTIHAAKGGEWAFVHIAGLVEGILPHHRALEGGEEADEARLFYVAATRAARLLSVSTNGEGPASRFLARALAA
jgi:DNA helicase-2/ATP-dependent DNA helicase PcrA